MLAATQSCATLSARSIPAIRRAVSNAIFGSSFLRRGRGR